MVAALTLRLCLTKAQRSISLYPFIIGSRLSHDQRYPGTLCSWLVRVDPAWYSPLPQAGLLVFFWLNPAIVFRKLISLPRRFRKAIPLATCQDIFNACLQTNHM